MSQAYQRRMMAETSQSVHCMRCRLVRVFSMRSVRMNWRAEQSDSQMMVSRWLPDWRSTNAECSRWQC